MLTWVKGWMQGVVLKRVLPRGGRHLSPENLYYVSLLLSFQITPISQEVTLAILVFCMWCTARKSWGPAIWALLMILSLMGSSFPNTGMCFVPYNDLAVCLARQRLVTLIPCISVSANSPTPSGYWDWADLSKIPYASLLASNWVAMG